MGQQSALRAVAQGQHAAHVLHHFFHDSQAQPAAHGRSSGLVRAEEGLRQAGQNVLRHAAAMVVHLQLHIRAHSLGLYRQLGHVCARGFAIAARVFHQVGYHARQLHFIGRYT